MLFSDMCLLWPSNARGYVCGCMQMGIEVALKLFCTCLIHEIAFDGGKMIMSGLTLTIKNPNDGAAITTTRAHSASFALVQMPLLHY